jgi:hypothetical protein
MMKKLRVLARRSGVPYVKDDRGPRIRRGATKGREAFFGDETFKFVRGN